MTREKKTTVEATMLALSARHLLPALLLAAIAFAATRKSVV